MSVLSTILPTDVHADILLRGVEEGSLTRDRAEALAAREGGELIYAVRNRLNALAAFLTLPDPECAAESALTGECWCFACPDEPQLPLDPWPWLTDEQHAAKREQVAFERWMS